MVLDDVEDILSPMGIGSTKGHAVSYILDSTVAPETELFAVSYFCNFISS